MNLLGGLGALGNIGNMMKQAQEFQQRMQQMTEQLKAKRVTGTAGGGLIEVTLTGEGVALAVRIDPTLIEKQDRELIEDLLPTAMNDGRSKVEELKQQMLAEATGGMNLPGMEGLMEKLGGAGPGGA
jgi:DNA-binding YbaB/EbfC family protein